MPKGFSHLQAGTPSINTTGVNLMTVQDALNQQSVASAIDGYNQSIDRIVNGSDFVDESALYSALEALEEKLMNLLNNKALVDEISDWLYENA